MNLPDYFRSELNKCQSTTQIVKLVAVIKHLAIVRAIELDEYSERALANQFGVTNTRIMQIKKNTPKGEANV